MLWCVHWFHSFRNEHLLGINGQFYAIAIRWLSLSEWTIVMEVQNINYLMRRRRGHQPLHSSVVHLFALLKCVDVFRILTQRLNAMRIAQICAIAFHDEAVDVVAGVCATIAHTHTHTPYLNSSQIMLKSMICMFSLFSLHLNCSPRLFSILRYVLCVRCTSARCTCSFRLFHVTWIAVTDSNAWIYNWKRRKREKKSTKTFRRLLGYGCELVPPHWNRNAQYAPHSTVSSIVAQSVCIDCGAHSASSTSTNANDIHSDGSR